MSLQLPDDPADYFLKQVLLDGTSWHPSETAGFDPNAAYGTDAFFEVDTSIDTVGESYPTLIIQQGPDQSTASGTTYGFMTPDGPGQDRAGSLTATVRVQDTDDGYTGDSSTYSPVDADDLVSLLVKQVENVCARNAAGGGTEFRFLGSGQLGEPPDDTDASPIVRIDSCTIQYGWRRAP